MTLIAASSFTVPTLIGNQCAVADDGLISISADYACPEGTSLGNQFDLGANPSGTAFSSLTGVDYYGTWPGAFSLQNSTRQTRNGLTRISATFIGATDPARVYQSQSVDARSYRYQDTIGIRNFDYRVAIVTFRYALPWDSTADMPNALGVFPAAFLPISSILSTYNVVLTGTPDGTGGTDYPPAPSLRQVITQTVETVGLIKRVSRTASGLVSLTAVTNDQPWTPQDVYP